MSDAPETGQEILMDWRLEEARVRAQRGIEEMKMEIAGLHAEDEHEYVDVLVTFENGVVVGCETMGEGRQVEPLKGPVVMQMLPMESAHYWHVNRLARRLSLMLSRL